MTKNNDGLYLFYMENGKAYSVLLTTKQWEALQLQGHSIVGDNIRLLEPSIGEVDVSKSSAVGKFHESTDL